jgi:putative membrane protein
LPTSVSYRGALAIAFLAVWLLLAVDPVNRAHWAAENLIVLAFVVALWLIRDRVAFSRFSMAAIFTFLCLHEIGAHHGYALVPYEAWLERLTGTTLEATLGVERNHYDRLVHLAFGVLLSWPIREFLVQTSAVRGRWSYLLPVALVMAAAMAYEVAEWLAVALVAPAGEGADLLGTQGDVWDAQKDMALAAAGSMLAMTVAVNLRPEQARRRQPRDALAGTSDQAASA